MRKKLIQRVAAALLLGAACALFLLNQSFTAINAAAPLNISAEPAVMELLALADQAASGGAQAEKNPYVAALEKQIAGQENKPAEEVFKNIQLLKGMPAGRILRVMEVAFNTSLGVTCTHCHLPDQWEKDDKEAKQTARKMWHFVSKVNQELQQAIGKGVVNCTTCHRGQVKPATSMPSPR
jgi:hypothetical protein